MKSYLKPLPGKLTPLMYWIAGVSGTVMVSVAIGLAWAAAR